jgi:DNA invertase Pin-like site-specific DNA recombinase
MIRQRIRAGLRRAVEAGKQLGRPKIDPALEKRIQSQLRAGKGMLAIARDLGAGTRAAYRARNESRSPFRRRNRSRVKAH